MEHRWGARRVIGQPVELHRRGADPLLGRIVDLSVSGAFIHTDGAVPPLARLEVVIDGIAVPAWVVRRTAGGIGVEWCQFAPSAIGTILRAPQRAVRAHAGRGDGADLAA